MQKSIMLLSFSLALVSTELAAGSYRSAGASAVSQGVKSAPPPSTVSRSTSSSVSASPSVSSSSLPSSSTYTPNNSSSMSNSFNSQASKGAASNWSPGLQAAHSQGRVAAAIPQRVPTPFIPNSSKGVNKYPSVSAANRQPVRTAGMTPQARVNMNRQRGQAFEARGKQLGLERPKTSYQTPYGRTVPDYKDQGHLIDMKNVNYLSNTKQMKAQRLASNGKHAVVVAPHTRVSEPLRKSSTEIIYLIP